MPLLKFIVAWYSGADFLARLNFKFPHGTVATDRNLWSGQILNQTLRTRKYTDTELAEQVAPPREAERERKRETERQTELFFPFSCSTACSLLLQLFSFLRYLFRFLLLAKPVYPPSIISFSYSKTRGRFTYFISWHPFPFTIRIHHHPPILLHLLALLTGWLEKLSKAWLIIM